MSRGRAHLAGEIADWPSKNRMAEILRTAGLRIVEGRFSIRIEECAHYVFQDYGGDIGEPRIDADAESAEQLLRDSKLVSDALGRAGIRHRFEIYDELNVQISYLHHDWPAQGD